jgi:hypothetical protein
MRQLALDLKTNYKNLTVLTVKSTLNSVRIEKARRTAAYLENKNGRISSSDEGKRDDNDSDQRSVQ